MSYYWQDTYWPKGNEYWSVNYWSIATGVAVVSAFVGKALFTLRVTTKKAFNLGM